MRSPPEPKPRHPIGIVPKTMAHLLAYQEKHRTETDPEPVAKGIWYEVAFFTFLGRMLSRGWLGGTILVHDWGSSEDNAGRDATISIPEIGINVSIDVTTDIRKKTVDALELHHEWFNGKKDTLEIDESKRINGVGVGNLIEKAFGSWLKTRIGPDGWQALLDHVKRRC